MLGSWVAGAGLARVCSGFARTMCRYGVEVFPVARRELRSWRECAERIPDSELSRHALKTLAMEAGNSEGAALFATLAPRRHQRSVIRLLVAYQTMYDYLDTISEQPVADPIANGHRLHRALVAAVGGEAADVDYYAHHSRRHDGGYLRQLVDACRRTFASLPSAGAALGAVCEAAQRSGMGQTLNHAARHGDGGPFTRWAAGLAPRSGLEPWEVACSTGSTLSTHALLAAAGGRLAESDAIAVEAAYFPWAGALNALLDSLVDAPDDGLTGNPNHLEHYAGPAEAAARLGAIARRSMEGLREVPAGDRHATILAAMIAFYLSRPEASLPQARPVRDAVLEAIGPHAAPALAVLRARRALSGRPPR